MIIVLIGSAILLAIFGAAFVSKEGRTVLTDAAEIAVYFVQLAIRLIGSEPLFIANTLLSIAAYIFTMKYFAQTAAEKKIGNYLIPATAISLPICLMLGAAMVMGQLASQGAGQWPAVYSYSPVRLIQHP